MFELHHYTKLEEKKKKNYANVNLLSLLLLLLLLIIQKRKKEKEKRKKKAQNSRFAFPQYDTVFNKTKLSCGNANGLNELNSGL